jgi:hypothetical protein
MDKETMAPVLRPFRLLDLPGELRERIYHYALCSFSCQEITPRIWKCFDPFASKTPYPRKFLGNTNLVLTDRLIYSEAQLYMLKTNLFVRIRSYGFDVTDVLASIQLRR